MSVEVAKTAAAERTRLEGSITKLRALNNSVHTLQDKAEAIQRKLEGPRDSDRVEEAREDPPSSGSLPDLEDLVGRCDNTVDRVHEVLDNILKLV